MKKYIYLLCALFMTQLVYGQGTITGTILDMSDGEPIIGARVTILHTKVKTITNVQGEFVLENIPNGEHVLQVSAIGYPVNTQDVTIMDNLIQLREILINPTEIGLKEVKELASYASHRMSPVTFSRIDKETIADLSVHNTLTEVMEYTPAIYVTRKGGGYGDSKLRLRGYNMRYIPILLNGIPINNMEDGSFNWGHRLGLFNFTRSIQVQRGVGNSALAVPSIGGTINILTKSIDRHRGGTAFASIGNDGYNNIGLALSTGETKKHWAFTLGGAHTGGQGYIEGNYLNAWSYYASVSKEINEHHLLQITVIGASQAHGQRIGYHSIGNELDVYGLKYNNDFGYKDGKLYLSRESFSHKPHLALNYYWNMENGSSLKSSIYYSMGRGGSTRALGGIGGSSINRLKPDEDGHIKWDEIVQYNKGETSEFGRRENPFIFQVNGAGLTSIDTTHRAFIADGTLDNGLIKGALIHRQKRMGLLSVYEQSITDYLRIEARVDGRYYQGTHYGKLLNLLGNKYWFEQRNVNQREDWVDLNRNGIKDAGEYGNLITGEASGSGKLSGGVKPENRIHHDYDAMISFLGLSGKVEYLTGVGFTAYVSGALSNKSYKRIERFSIGEGEQVTDWDNFLGGNVKLGLNYNVNENHNVYLNAGYYSLQPTFNTIYPYFNNDAIVDRVTNEKVYDVELGYGYRNRFFNAHLNGYYTASINAQESIPGMNVRTGENVYAHLLGVNAIHKGIELELNARFFDDILNIGGLFTINDWYRTTSSDAILLDRNHDIISEKELFVKGLKIGNAPQTSFAILAEVKVVKNLSADARFHYFNRMYAAFNPVNYKSADAEGVQTILLPDYGITGVGLTYRFNLLDMDFKLRGTVNNLLDVNYISEAMDIRNNNGESYEARLKNLYGWYGYGRTWGISLRIDF